MKRKFFFFFTLFLGLPILLFADIKTQVRLDLFSAPGCTECERIKHEVLPKLNEEFEGMYELVEHDTTNPTNIPLLVAYQDRCKNKDNGRASLVVDHTYFLSGFEVISTGISDRVDACLADRQSPSWKVPAPPVLEREAEQSAAVQNRLSGLSLTVVAIGGLLDGFNPCAISTLIFFLSLLAISHAKRQTRFLVGFFFIFASFAVYMSLGLGFLYIFRRIPAFPIVKRVTEIVLGLCMIPLAYLSFRDAFRFRKTRRADAVSLQIPNSIKRKIHSFMHLRLGWGGPALGGLVVGAVVTILESVCTGQSYVPVLMYVIKDNSTNLTAWFLLTLYNLLFVLPLVVVFLCFHRGLEIPALLEWSKRNLVVIKILLGVFFAAMAALLLIRF